MDERPELATYDVKTAQRMLGIGRNQFYLALRRGQVPAVRVGSSWRILKAPFRQLLGLPPDNAK